MVVSLRKAGTHLILRLIEELGYTRRYFDEPLRQAVRGQSAETFFASLEPNAAYFLHEAPIHGFPPHVLDYWRTHDDPRFIYQYRDPRALLLSLVNYLRRSHQSREFSNTPEHLMFSEILSAQATEHDALSVAIDTMGRMLEESFLGSVWMLHHPRVLSLTFECLRSKAEALDEVSRVLRFLGLEGDAQQIASRLYDPSQRTFHHGDPDRWSEIYTPNLLRRFESRYGHLLDTYGYRRHEV